MTMHGSLQMICFLPTQLCYKGVVVCHYPEEEYLNDLLDDLRDYYWDEEYLKYIHDHAKETRNLFGNKGKRESERMVCRAFLKCARIPFTEEEIILSTKEPPDVLFKSAKFEICMLLDEGREPGAEWRQLANAKNISDVLCPFPSPKYMSLREAISRVTSLLKDKKADKYGKCVCGNLDALVYVNLREIDLVQLSLKEEIETINLDVQGWRSVSMLMDRHAVVLQATSTAPPFLQDRLGIISERWPDEEVLFEPKCKKQKEI